MNSESGFIFKTTGFSLYIGSPQKGDGEDQGLVRKRREGTRLTEPNVRYEP